jgi:hypothetical protein
MAAGSFGHPLHGRARWSIHIHIRLHMLVGSTRVCTHRQTLIEQVWYGVG